MIRFQVYGLPVAQGSKKTFLVNGAPRMKETASGHAPWRNEVSSAAAKAKEEAGLIEPLDGPLLLVVVFRFAMPKSRPAAARKAGVAYKTSAPDTDKLVRSIGDSLTAAALITDDARFASITATKVETTDWTGVDITVDHLTGEPLHLVRKQPAPRRLRRG